MYVYMRIKCKERGVYVYMSERDDQVQGERV